MRLIINLILVAIIALLIYALYDSIREPIAFKAQKERRERAVQDKLTKIRTAQEAFRDITGQYAGTFDTLSHVLTNGRFSIIQVFGDPDDPNFTGQITYDTLYRSAKDSMQKVLGVTNFDSLRYVPFGNGATFDVQSDVIEYQGSEVPVIQVGTPYKAFMGAFADKRFARYDQKYDPEAPIKFGNLNSPNLAGNW